MASVLGDVLIKLSGDTSEFTSEFAFAGTQISQTVAGISASLMGVGTAITSMTADMQRAVTRAAVIADGGKLTQESFKALEQTAIELGAKTEFTSRQVADAMVNMAMAGNDATKTIAALPAVLNLATAGNVDLAESAKIVNSVMAAYKVNGTELGSVNDMLVAAFTGSSNSLQELAGAFKTSAPIARTLGVRLENLVATIAVLGNAGLRSEDAGTGLKAALAHMTAGSKPAMEALAQLGLAAEDSGKGFDFIVERLEMARSRIGDETKLMGLMFNAFGTDGGPKLAALLGQGSKAITDMMQRFKDTKGISQAVATAQLETFDGQVEQLKGSVESLGTAFGQQLIPMLQPVVLGLKDIVDGLNEMNPELKKGIIVVGGIAAAFTAVAAPILGVLAVLPSVISGFLAVKAAVVSLAPALIAAFSGFGVFGTMGDVLINVAGKIGVVGAAVATFTASFSLVRYAIEEVTGKTYDLGEVAKDALRTMNEGWAGVITVTKNAGLSLAQATAQLVTLGGFFGVFSKDIDDFFNSISDGADTATRSLAETKAEAALLNEELTFNEMHVSIKILKSGIKTVPSEVSKAVKSALADILEMMKRARQELDKLRGVDGKGGGGALVGIVQEMNDKIEEFKNAEKAAGIGKGKSQAGYFAAQQELIAAEKIAAMFNNIKDFEEFKETMAQADIVMKDFTDSAKEIVDLSINRNATRIENEGIEKTNKDDGVGETVKTGVEDAAPKLTKAVADGSKKWGDDLAGIIGKNVSSGLQSLGMSATNGDFIGQGVGAIIESGDGSGILALAAGVGAMAAGVPPQVGAAVGSAIEDMLPDLKQAFVDGVNALSAFSGDDRIGNTVGAGMEAAAKTYGAAFITAIIAMILVPFLGVIGPLILGFALLNSVVIGVYAAIFSMAGQTKKFAEMQKVFGAVFDGLIAMIEDSALADSFMAFAGLFVQIVEAMKPFIDVVINNEALMETLFNIMKGLAMAGGWVMMAFVELNNVIAWLWSGMLGFAAWLEWDEDKKAALLKAQEAATASIINETTKNEMRAALDGLANLTFQGAKDLAAGIEIVADEFDGLAESTQNVPSGYWTAAARGDVALGPQTFPLQDMITMEVTDPESVGWLQMIYDAIVNGGQGGGGSSSAGGTAGGEGRDWREWLHRGNKKDNFRKSGSSFRGSRFPNNGK